ncbi:MAG: DUF1285 domain-containing protein [Pacificimonas sp.]
MTSSEKLSAADTGLPMSLSDVIRQMAGDRPPPVESWDPPHRGDSQMRIAADGSWYHQGDPIRRERLVTLFASILRRDGDEFVLVTPGEKLSIEVEDAPFVAVEVAVEAGDVVFRLKTGGYVKVDADHPVFMRDAKPYVRVRGGLDARIARAPWYELAAAVTEEDGLSGLRAGGVFVPL